VHHLLPRITTLMFATTSTPEAKRCKNPRMLLSTLCYDVDVNDSYLACLSRARELLSTLLLGLGVSCADLVDGFCTALWPPLSLPRPADATGTEKNWNRMIHSAFGSVPTTKRTMTVASDPEAATLIVRLAIDVIVFGKGFRALAVPGDLRNSRSERSSSLVSQGRLDRMLFPQKQ
jgi:hypothetical protein